nr:DUF559 domain-containing protein [Massilia antarctica]
MKKTCQQCQVDFETDQKSAKYCSRPCFNIRRQVPKHKPCEACGLSFLSDRVRLAKYCSRACYSVGKTIRTRIPCAQCSTVFLPANGKIKFCSKACAYKDRSGRPCADRKTGEEKTCAECGVGIYVQRNLVKDSNFCGRVCHDAYQSRAKVDRTCAVCTKAFRLSPSTAARSAGRYCSIACRSKCPVWRLNAPVAANLKQLHAKGPNRLELAGRAILEEIGLLSREQVLIEGRFAVDVVLDGHSVVIQWDGGYWHGYRSPSDSRPLDARQTARTTFDRSQDAFMRSRGYHILRFWDHEVYKEPHAVAATIKAALLPKS